MEKIKYNGELFNVYGANEDLDYAKKNGLKQNTEHIVYANTGNAPDKKQKEIAIKLLAENGIHVNKDDDNTHSFIRQLLGVLKNPDAIREYDDGANIAVNTSINTKNAFIVFQNSNQYKDEKINGIIEAPKADKSGKQPHLWGKLKDVRTDDVIFHMSDKKIKAISVAKGSMYSNNGTHNTIDCIYHELPNSIYLDNFRNEIKSACNNVKSAPFNRNGTGNQGYLFDLPQPLVNLFVDEAKKLNPGMDLTFLNGIYTGNSTQSNGGNIMNKTEQKLTLNMILYGPPGTGKTYNTKKYAVAICDYNGDLSSVEKLDYDTVITPRYNELVSEGRVQFTTFHQSYGYEEFIEGIKPETNANGNITYSVRSGVFKTFCEKAEFDIDIDKVLENSPSIYKVTLKEGASNDVKNNCFKEGLIRLDYDDNQKYLDDNFSKLNVGDIVLSLKSANSLDGIGVVTDNTPFDLDNEKEYKHAVKVNWLLTNLDINTLKYNDNKQFSSNSTISSTSFNIETFKAMVNDYDLNKKKPYVFIIDEINRGNISKIFGELITLIEDSKRGGAKEEMSATLPYSGECFSVPNNVYILGTMNTADRSISLMDTALRRRFDFIEMMPKPSIVNKTVAGVDIEKMLEKINDRITVLYDREHTIGHAFFKGLNGNSTIDDLALIFKNKVIPLLQEYFYEDYSKIRLVLGDNGKVDAQYQFIHEIDNSTKNVFKGNYDPDLVENFSYEINDKALKEPQSYIQIYK